MTVITRLWRRPTASLEMLTVCAWAATATMLAGEAVAHSGPGEGSIWWCGLNDMAGMTTPSTGSALPAALAGGMPMWMVMSCAMMLPATFPAARAAANADQAGHTHAAVGRFLAGYLLVWAAYGVLVVALAAILGQAAKPAALLSALALAAGWQLTRSKLRLLRATRDPVRLSAGERRCSLQTLGYGVRGGAACLGSCWAIMLVMALASGERLLWMVALASLVLVEHRARHERRVLGAGAGLLGVAALVALLMS